MSQPAPSLEADIMDQEQELFLVPRPPDDGDPEEDELRFPDYEFVIPKSQMVKGESLFTIQTETRVRATLEALKTSGAITDQRWPSPNFRIRQMNAASNFMKKHFSYQGNDYYYRDLVNLDETEKTLLFALLQQNHPVAQVLAKVAEEYGKDIGPKEFGNIVHNVLTVTHWPILREFYSARVAEFRSQLVPQKRRAKDAAS